MCGITQIFGRSEGNRNETGESVETQIEIKTNGKENERESDTAGTEIFNLLSLFRSIEKIHLNNVKGRKKNRKKARIVDREFSMSQFYFGRLTSTFPKWKKNFYEKKENKG